MCQSVLSKLNNYRPFKIRNAEEIDEAEILDLLVVPGEGTEEDPLDFTNLIIKGEMGSGKTMLLRANYALYKYNLIPSILDRKNVVIPLYIRLNDFSQHSDPETIFKEIYVEIIHQLIKSLDFIDDSEELVKLHKGVSTLYSKYHYGSKSLKKINIDLLKLSSDEYCTKVRSNIQAGGGIKSQFVEATGKIESEDLLEIKRKPSPGIIDVRRVFEALFPSKTKLLILIDEAGSLSPKFFLSSDSKTPLFETLMNQLRTADFVRAKVAVYPNSFSDTLYETRYGDFLYLTYNIERPDSYIAFRKILTDLVERYILSTEVVKTFHIDEFLESNLENPHSDYGDVLEQVINGSQGNFRRAMFILDKALRFAASENSTVICKHHVMRALEEQGRSIINLYTKSEQQFIETLATLCVDRSTFKFQLPYKAQTLSKYCKSKNEGNILRIYEPGGGQRGITYSFDYSYCVLRKIPTHYTKDTNKIQANRSIEAGKWITKRATLREDNLKQAEVAGRLKGVVQMILENKRFGVINSDAEDGKNYFFLLDEGCLTEKDKEIIDKGKTVKFSATVLGQTDLAENIEVLD